ncbi:hypothetical protein FIBSPDRAFT_925380 [Athelia psychrophila]|uniref:Uncharacterized protein n=1 Tax=Athelia psychrophila TaxID=1759441 RepID=A0A166UQE1_9AGAM|nr:hypothetical protein FIBSPDRAFT_925380 [Fibularhizoctonia sp. CBS 109695]
MHKHWETEMRMALGRHERKRNGKSAKKKRPPFWNSSSPAPLQHPHVPQITPQTLNPAMASISSTQPPVYPSQKLTHRPTWTIPLHPRDLAPKRAVEPNTVSARWIQWESPAGQPGRGHVGKRRAGGGRARLFLRTSGTAPTEIEPKAMLRARLHRRFFTSATKVWQTPLEYVARRVAVQWEWDQRQRDEDGWVDGDGGDDPDWYLCMTERYEDHERALRLMATGVGDF